jgi:hypothetical protein
VLAYGVIGMGYRMGYGNHKLVRESEMTVTKEQLIGALRVMDVIVDCIKEGGDNGIPSGHLYAHLMGSMRLETYEKMIGMLIEAGRIKRSNHVLYYVKR